MALSTEVKDGVNGVLDPEWEIRSEEAVPATEDIGLTDDAVRLDATYLYADMAGSSPLAQGYEDWAAAKAIRCYLNAAARIVRARGGQIRSFDGDHFMALFVGRTQNSNAATAALNISWAVEEVINPVLAGKWEDFTWEMQHRVGIDAGPALLVRGGVRKENDIIAVGAAPNVAARLSALDGRDPLRISRTVYDKLNNLTKYTEPDNGKEIWAHLGAEDIGGTNVTYYGSSYQWEP